MKEKWGISSTLQTPRELPRITTTNTFARRTTHFKANYNRLWGRWPQTTTMLPRAWSTSLTATVMPGCDNGDDDGVRLLWGWIAWPVPRRCHKPEADDTEISSQTTSSKLHLRIQGLQFKIFNIVLFSAICFFKQWQLRKLGTIKHTPFLRKFKPLFCNWHPPINILLYFHQWAYLVSWRKFWPTGHSKRFEKQQVVKQQTMQNKTFFPTFYCANCQE